MLGSDLLAAPVLKNGSIERDVLLPPGDWTDAWTGKPVDAGFHPGHPSPCPGIPVFVRSHRMDLISLLSEALSEIPRGSMSSGQVSTTYSAGLDRDIDVTG